MKKQCANCRFFDERPAKEEWKPDTGACRRNPPIARYVQGMGNEAVITLWPRVHVKEWCGEYKPGEVLIKNKIDEYDQQFLQTKDYCKSCGQVTEWSTESIEEDFHCNECNYMEAIETWPRVCFIERDEQARFTKELAGQNRPVLHGKKEVLPDSQQDAYYQHHYDQWKRGLPPLD